jgi:xanthine dehydrogenase accessory factor
VNELNEDILDTLAALRRQGQALVLVTVVAKEGHGPAAPGAKMLVAADGRRSGTIGGGALEHIAIKKAQGLILSKTATLYEVYDFGAEGQAGEQAAAPGAQATGMVCGGRASLFYEYYGAGESLVLFGAGHIGRALARLLPGMGYSVTVIDSRKDYIESFAEAVRQNGGSLPGLQCVCHEYGKSFAGLALPENSRVVVATHSHDLDYQVLEQVFKARLAVRSVGVVASRKKRDKFFAQLKEAVPDADTSLVYMPAGLDIGGTGPEEIALSLVAELQALRYGRTGHKHMRDKGGAN